MKIFLDENLSEHVAEALNILGRNDFPSITVLSTKDAPGTGEPDEVVIPYVAGEGGVLVTRDYNIKRTGMQYELCRRHKLGIMFLHLPKGTDRHWNLVKLLVHHWESIVTACSTKKRPFAYRILQGKMEELK